MPANLPCSSPVLTCGGTWPCHSASAPASSVISISGIAWHHLPARYCETHSPSQKQFSPIVETTELSSLQLCHKSRVLNKLCARNHAYLCVLNLFFMEAEARRYARIRVRTTKQIQQPFLSSESYPISGM